MEVQLIEHIRHSLLIDRNKDLIIEKLLNLTLEIISLLTREDFMVVRKSGDHVSEGSASPVSDRCTPSPAMEASPPQSPAEERILEPSRTYRRKTKEFPRDPQDVEVSFSMTDYDDSEAHKDEVMVHPQPHSSAGECSSSSPPERCENPVYSQDYIKEEVRIMTLDYQDDPDSGPEMFHSQYKEEAAPLHPDCPGEGSSRDLPERCESPPYPDCIEEEETRIIQQEYQAEPVDGMFLPQCKEEDDPVPISSGCDTGTETFEEPDGEHHGGLDDVPPDPYAGPHVSSLYPGKMESQRPVSNHSDHVTHPKPLSGSDLYSCPICGACFNSLNTFASHQQSHTRKVLFHCSICGKYFNQRSSFVTHRRTHTGESPYSCSVCRRAFDNRSSLILHQRVHSGEKPYECTECGRHFGQKSNLVKHRRIHTGEKPFVCPQCGRCFSNGSNLVRHQRIHKAGDAL